MPISIDIFVLSLVLLTIVFYCLWVIKVMVFKQVAQHKQSQQYVYCRFCRDQYSLTSPKSSQVAKESVNDPSKKSPKGTAICPQCGRTQWRGSSKSLL